MPDGDIWQQFTNPAIRVIHFAQEEARRFGIRDACGGDGAHSAWLSPGG